MLIDVVKVHNYQKNGAALTAGDVAEILGIQESTVELWTNMGVLESFIIPQSGECLYRCEDITTFMDGLNKQSISKLNISRDTNAYRF